MSEQLLFLQNLGLTLLLGSLIGLERERTRHQEDVHEFGGIRTLSLISILGYLVYSLFPDSIFFYIVTAGFLGLLIASYVMASYIDKTNGATTEIAGLFTYLIGILMAKVDLLIAAVITLIVVLLLYFKKPLHRLAHSIEKEELYDTIKFIAVVFVVLPLLPNQTFGPLNILNPYEIWLIVVLISSISFISYVAIKVVGPKRGIGVGGFLGGLTSSTAVSLSFSQMSKKTNKVVNPFVFGILIACSAMFFRVLLTISILNADLVKILYIPMFSMGGLGLLLALYFWFKPEGKSLGHFSEKELHLKSPFQLMSALHFGLLFAALLFVSKFAADYFGSQGIYLMAFLSGILDVDAIAVSMANLSKDGQITSTVAATGITLAAMTNTVSKGFIVFFLGSRKVGWRSLLALITMALLGGASLVFIA